MATTRMRPSQIYYNQDDVGSTIDTPAGDRDMIKVFEDLVARRISADSIACIQVVNYQGRVYVHDGNRRLLMFKVRC